MKKSLLVSAFVLLLGISSYVVGGATSFGPPACSGTWCTVHTVYGEETFCCQSGTSCPDPNGNSTDCVNESS